MLIPIILSGGAGTRLWPVSREGHPKPFMKLSDGRMLLDRTFERALACRNVQEAVTITNREYYFQSKDCWNVSPERADIEHRFLLEPVGRNTAPAILLGAFEAQSMHEDAVMLVLPADHLINDVQAFSRDVDLAIELAKEGNLVTFGIKPERPETGFGYIRSSEKINGHGYRASGFVEKPDREKAQSMINAGGYYWNSGMFCFRAKDLIAAFSEHAPQMLEAAQICWEATNCQRSDGYCELDSASFSQLEDISIDYAIMEKAKNVAIVEGSFDWSDIGSWSALAEMVPADAEGNRVLGDVVTLGTKNCFVQSADRTVATIGLENIVIIDTPDALLVSHRDKVQQVREVVKHLKRKGSELYKLHRTVFRPWGTYTVLEDGHRHKIKRIEVKPGASLSLQMHHHRSEHWIVVCGMARVVNGDGEFLVATNESTYIPAGHKHRLENPGVIDLVMIEVQSGEYLGEDDIVRYEDKYGRVAV